MDQTDIKPLNEMCAVVMGETVILGMAINTFIAPLVKQEKNKIIKNVSLSVNTPQLFGSKCIT